MASVFVFLCVVLALRYERTLVLAVGESCKDCGDNKPKGMALRSNTTADGKQLVREFIKPDVKPMIKVAKFPLALGFGAESITGEVDGSRRTSDEEPVERKAVPVRPNVTCVLALLPVSLRESDDPGITYVPDCTLLEQCSGCCMKEGLSCQPINTETVIFKVTVLYAGNKMRNKRKEVSRKKHTKCKCDCIVKEKDCNEHQVFDGNLCRCFCTNTDAERKCHQGSNKHWNSENCSCECRSDLDCQFGTYFDQITCSCEWLPDNSASKQLPNIPQRKIYHYEP